MKVEVSPLFRFLTWKLNMRLLLPILLVGAAIIVAIGLTGYLTTRSALVEQAQDQARAIVERSSLAIDNNFAPLAVIPGIVVSSEQRTIEKGTREAQYQRMLPDLLSRTPLARNVYAFFEKQV